MKKPLPTNAVNHTDVDPSEVDPLAPLLPSQPGDRLVFGNVMGSALSLLIAHSTQQEPKRPLLVITASSSQANTLKRELKYLCAPNTRCFQFPDWEILPYDHFSPHQDIVSERLKTLSELPHLTSGIVIIPISTLLHRMISKDFVVANSFSLKIGDTLNPESLKAHWVRAGYRAVSQVVSHGEYAVRGSIIDIFPMGQTNPIRIDLFDNEIESLRLFDIDTQRSLEKIDNVNCLPAHEYPLDEDAIARFRHHWRTKFSGDPTHSPIYESISAGTSIGGVEYYLPLFFDKTSTFFDFLPANTVIFKTDGVETQIQSFSDEVNRRYEQYRHDIERPILSPQDLFIPENELFGALKSFAQVFINTAPHAKTKTKGQHMNLAFGETIRSPELVNTHEPLKPLKSLIDSLHAQNQRVLICAESTGRQEALLQLLDKIHLKPKLFNHWRDFYKHSSSLGITLTSLNTSLSLPTHQLYFLAEADIYGQQVMQRRRRKEVYQDIDYQIRNLAELQMGHPVVHFDHGVGRYQGLVNLTIGQEAGEYLVIEYADAAKLYVPVTMLNLISQYSGTHIEHAPLHRLGSDHWEKSKQKAQKKITDIAAELLDIQAQRALKQGYRYQAPDEDYLSFSNAFGFETTPDQQAAIDQVLSDMQSERPMDRLVCGDVGFGKTEVALRASFMAVMQHKQVLVLVPTTLLAQQHFETFSDRFAKWPVKIEVLSRFRSSKEQTQTLENLKNGKADIVIGTHKLLNQELKVKQLGLLIIDEEHRFGVKQKEKIKKLRAEVDILTLTATPIPRTLNLAISAVRDLSIIATPPLKRLSIKTFVRPFDEHTIQEAINRELMRGGQVYYLHNEVSTIENKAQHLRELCPEARIIVAHGQMSERVLERVMSDFYHQRYNILVCTTIIETGIDIPSANTIIIERADKFGLAQLHQIRGRVGRSHHQAYAYCLTPAHGTITADAQKRLEALESLEELGSGFTLATHDLEIRGAGDILGEEQSGNIDEIGFTLYRELLEKTVNALKQGKPVDINAVQQSEHVDIDLQIPAFIPDHYLPDVHTRLILYKRIGLCADLPALNDIQVEMIDRFGLLPEEVKNLFKLTVLKQTAQALDIQKIEAGAASGKIKFVEKPKINPEKIINLIKQHPLNYKLTGSDTFRFIFEMPTVEQRFKVVENLLEQLH